MSSRVGAPPHGYTSGVSCRRWTRLGVVGMSGHLAYELAAGVGVPLAPRVGVRAAVTAYGVASVVGYRAAGRLPSPRGDQAFAVVNGFFLAAVVAHLTSWPRTSRGGLPWLVECEGLEGRVIGPYNALLYVSGVCAIGGAVENRRGWRWFAATAVLATPWLRRQQHSEYERLLDQAAHCSRWWNRRLRPGAPGRS